MNSASNSIRLKAPTRIWQSAPIVNLRCRTQLRTFNGFAHSLRPPSAPRIYQILSKSTWRRLPRNPRTIRFNSSKPSPNPTQNLGSPEPSLTYSQRFRKLGREYGWSAMGIYLTLSALDFPFCFLAVRYLGTERIARWEHAVVEGFWRVIGVAFPNIRGSMTNTHEVGQGGDVAVQESGGWGVEEAEAENRSDRASIWTQLALAYAIHKSFIFLRLPFTVAITPKVVKTLRSWGWNIGKRKAKSAGNT